MATRYKLCHGCACVIANMDDSGRTEEQIKNFDQWALTKGLLCVVGQAFDDNSFTCPACGEESENGEIVEKIVIP